VSLCNRLARKLISCGIGQNVVVFVVQVVKRSTFMRACHIGLQLSQLIEFGLVHLFGFLRLLACCLAVAHRQFSLQ
jgi:hypothetical protein